MIIGKQRHGPTGTVPLAFEAEITKFSRIWRRRTGSRRGCERATSDHSSSVGEQGRKVPPFMEDAHDLRVRVRLQFGGKACADGQAGTAMPGEVRRGRAPAAGFRPKRSAPDAISRTMRSAISGDATRA